MHSFWNRHIAGLGKSIIKIYIFLPVNNFSFLLAPMGKGTGKLSTTCPGQAKFESCLSEGKARIQVCFKPCIADWNSLSNNVVEADNVSKFKKLLYRHLLISAH